MINYRKFIRGLTLPPKVTSQNNHTGDMEVLLSDGKLYFYNNLQVLQNSPMVTENHTATIKNKIYDAPVIINGIIISGGISITGGLIVDNITGQAGSALTITSAASKNLSLQSNGADVLLESLIINANTITGGAANLTLQSGSNQNLNLISQGTGNVNISTSSNGNISLLPHGTGDIVLGTFITVDGSSGSITANPGDLNFQTLAAGNININPLGTGLLFVFNNGGVVFNSETSGVAIPFAGTIRLRDSDNSNFIGLKAPAVITSDYTITFPAAVPAASTALVYDGTNYIWSTAGGFSMNSNLLLAANNTIIIDINKGQQVWEVQGDAAFPNLPVVLSTTPFGATAPINGAVIRIIGRSNTNTVTILTSNIVNGCISNGDAILGLGDVIEYQYLTSILRFVEVSRNF